MTDVENQEEQKSQVEGDEEAKVEDNLPPVNVKIEEAGAAQQLPAPSDIPLRAALGAKLDEAFKELQHDAVMPGFRRGRAPKRLIEKRFGENIRNTVKQQVVAEAYEKAIEETKLDAIGEPEIDLSKIELPAQGNLTVTMEVEVSPEFELPSIENISVKRPKLEATDERLNLAVENLQKYFGNWHDSTDPVSEKDTVVADVKVSGG